MVRWQVATRAGAIAGNSHWAPKDVKAIKELTAESQMHTAVGDGSLLPSCESFEFGAKIREAFLLGKAPSEWLSPLVIKDALCRRRRELEVPVAEMVDRRAQEQAFPTAKSHAPVFKRSEGFLQFAAGLPTPKIAIKIRMLMQRLFVLHSGWGRRGPRDSVFIGMVGNQDGPCAYGGL